MCSYNDEDDTHVEDGITLSSHPHHVGVSLPYPVHHTATNEDVNENGES